MKTTLVPVGQRRADHTDNSLSANIGSGLRPIDEFQKILKDALKDGSPVHVVLTYTTKEALGACEFYGKVSKAAGKDFVVSHGNASVDFDASRIIFAQKIDKLDDHLTGKNQDFGLIAATDVPQALKLFQKCKSQGVPVYIEHLSLGSQIGERQISIGKVVDITQTSSQFPIVWLENHLVGIYVKQICGVKPVGDSNKHVGNQLKLADKTQKLIGG